MGLLRFFRKKPEKRDVKFSESLILRSSSSGVVVTEAVAKSSTAFAACIRVIKNSIGILPCRVIETQDEDNRKPLRNHPLWKLLNVSPCPNWTAIEFLRYVVECMCYRGNFYAQIVRNGAGEIVQLVPLNPDQMSIIVADDGKILYQYQPSKGPAVKLAPNKILNIPFESPNGLRGRSMIEQFTDSIGLTVSLERYACRFFKNDATPGGIIYVPNQLTDEAEENLRKSWRDMYSDEGQHSVGVLEEGTKFEKLSFNPKDAQFIEGREFQVDEMCRITGVPPHMIAQLKRSTNNNIEHQSIEWHRDGVVPWITTIEQRFDLQLLKPEELGRIQTKFDARALLRGDTKTRNEAYQIQFQNGILNADEIRAMEDRNPIPDGKGQVYYINSTLIPAGEKRDEPTADTKA